MLSIKLEKCISYDFADIIYEIEFLNKNRITGVHIGTIFGTVYTGLIYLILL